MSGLLARRIVCRCAQSAHLGVPQPVHNPRSVGTSGQVVLQGLYILHEEALGSSQLALYDGAIDPIDVTRPTAQRAQVGHVVPTGTPGNHPI